MEYYYIALVVLLVIMYIAYMNYSVAHFAVIAKRTTGGYNYAGGEKQYLLDFKNANSTEKASFPSNLLNKQL